MVLNCFSSFFTWVDTHCFRITQLLFWNSGLLLTYQRVSLKNNLCLLIKLSKENSYVWVKRFYFHELKLAIKISKEISYCGKCSQISFFIKRCLDLFSFNLLLMKFWFMSFTAFFCFWLEEKRLHKKVIKAKLRKTKYPFMDKVFNYDFTKFQKGWSNIAVVGAHGRLYSQYSVRIQLQNTLQCCLYTKAAVYYATYCFNTNLVSIVCKKYWKNCIS